MGDTNHGGSDPTTHPTNYLRCLDISDDDMGELLDTICKNRKPMFPEAEIRSLEEQIKEGKRQIKTTDVRGEVSTIDINPDQ